MDNDNQEIIVNPKEDVLKNIVELIEEDFSYTTHVATEIEFYFTGGDEALDNQLLAAVLKKCQDDEIVVANMTFETGHRQYEIALSNVNNAAIICEHTEHLKNILTRGAQAVGIDVNFSGKPFSNQPGCGLHIHVHLENNSRVNIFQKPDAANDDESITLEHAVGGLLDTMSESMIYFSPHEEDYARFSAKMNHDAPEIDDNPLRKYNNAPIKICWGSNNRTAAVRIPASTRYPEQRHIEHRVSSSSADIYEIMCAVVAGIHHGLKHKIEPSEKIHGNAFDTQYDRPLLPTTLKEAQKLAKKGRIIKAYLKV
jgi:glutamine synthetase